ncbi:hypothetical protein FRB98_008477 [Tulasnella sp. 332]|nr:hypothetical protein FRB98_008477 [Tulasnella sp. 332]
MRHGDIQGSYPFPFSYESDDQALTLLGETQSFNLGALLQSKYFLRSSSLAISTVYPETYSPTQSIVKADMGFGLPYITNSVTAAAQGIWPANTTMSSETLANGASVTPLNKGYQFVNVQTIDPNSQIYMDGTTDCGTLMVVDAALYGDPEFVAVAQNNSGFLSSLSQYVGGRPTEFSDINNIYQYINEQYIHNATFGELLPTAIMAQVQTLANWNSWAMYSSPSMGDVRNIAGQTMLYELLTVMNRFGNPADPLKFGLYGTSYIPFISLFQLLNVTQYHPELEGIVNYGAAISLELRTFSNDTLAHNYFIRFNFKNGTDDTDFIAYPMLGRPDGQYDVPISDFYTAVGPWAMGDLGTWCAVCNNTVDRGCDQAALLTALLQEMEGLVASGVLSGGGHKVSAAVGGVIGALVALVLALLLVFAMVRAGVMGWNGRKGAGSDAGMRRRSSTGISGVVVRAVTGGRPRHVKKDSGFAGDTESVRGIVKNPGLYEMMDDISELHTQVFDLGALLQSKYFLRSSSENIASVNPTIYDPTQSIVKADLGFAGPYIVNSVTAAAQGIWPANSTTASQTLANGGAVSPVNNGYQFVNVQTIDPNTALYMDGTTDCGALNVSDLELYSDPDFLAVAQNNSGFLSSLSGYVGGRSTLFAEIYNVYQFMSEQYIHNITFRQMVEAPVMAQVQTLANWNVWSMYSSPNMADIRNIGGQTMLSEILTVMNRFADKQDPLKFGFYGTSYIPFISLFQLLNVTGHHPELQGIVNYAGAISLEIRQMANATTAHNYYIRFNFKNGTDDADFIAYPMLGRLDGDLDVPITDFFVALAIDSYLVREPRDYLTQPYALSDLGAWCGLCSNAQDRGCDQASLITALVSELEGMAAPGRPGLVSTPHKLSPVAGGIIGAVIALVLATSLVVGLLATGVMSWKKGRSDTGTRRRNSIGISAAVIRAVTGGKPRHARKDSGFAGDAEGERGVVKNPGVYEMMDDASELRHIPSRAPSDGHGDMKL